MFQQFNPSIRSTLHRVTFAFVDWQYHTRFPVVRDTSQYHYINLISTRYQYLLWLQENTDKQSQYNSEKVNNLKYSKTILPWFSCLLQHLARKRGGLILQRPRAHTGPLTKHIDDTGQQTEVTWCIAMWNLVRQNSQLVQFYLTGSETRNQCRLTRASVMWSQVLSILYEWI